MGEMKGIIKFWNDERGFGFVEIGTFPQETDVFVHISECENYKPTKCDVITFSMGTNKSSGRECAIGVKYSDERVDSSYFDGRPRAQRANQPGGGGGGGQQYGGGGYGGGGNGFERGTREDRRGQQNQWN
jgi:cold shock CspA family protein